MKQITIETQTTQRLDAFLAEETGQTRSNIKNRIETGGVLVNGVSARAAQKLKPGDVVTVEQEQPQPIETQPQDIPIDIVFQDEWMAVVNKPRGMVVHPAAGNADGTLVNALLFHIEDLSGINGDVRPGIVHRLDKDTSGLLVIAKNDEAHHNLSAQIASKEAGRHYLALVHGNIKQDEGMIDAPIGRDPRDRKKMAVVRGGREAQTMYRVLERFGAYTLVECTLQTGRTHQIRVHLKKLGFPVVGDPLYTRQKNPFGAQAQMLHAYQLMLRHPKTGEAMCFEAPLPEDMARLLERLRAQAGQ